MAEALRVDLSEGSPLLAALRRNDKVTVHPDGSLQYKVPLPCTTLTFGNGPHARPPTKGLQSLGFLEPKPWRL